MKGRLANYSQEKEKPKCQPRGAGSLTAVKLIPGVLTLVSATGKEKSVAIHAETHSRDRVALSEEHSADLRRLLYLSTHF